MLTFKLCKVRVELYFGFFAVILFSMLLGSTDTYGVSAALVSCILHECGHLFAMSVLSEPPEKICLYAGGIKIVPPKRIINVRKAEVVILSAGCTVNLIISVISAALGLEKMSMINLALALFNLLPFKYFDGGRLLALFVGDRVRRLFVVLGALSLLALSFISGGISLAAAAVIVFAAASDIYM